MAGEADPKPARHIIRDKLAREKYEGIRAVPVLSNPRHERYAQELAKGIPQIKAYENAGYSADRGAACRLSAKAYISQRVAELQGMAAARVVQKAAVIDKSYVLQQAHRMFEASANAADSGAFDPKAANAAARFLDQIGRHVDVRAFAEQKDINLTISVDSALAQLGGATVEAIDVEWSDVTAENREQDANIDA